MDSLLGLAGVVVGGVLVVFSDIIRRRHDHMREGMKALADASVLLAATYNRLITELIQSRAAGNLDASAPPPHVEREEAVTRFFITPGSERVRLETAKLTKTYGKARERYSDEILDWPEVHQERRTALYAFERAVRSVLSR